MINLLASDWVTNTIRDVGGFLDKVVFGVVEILMQLILENNVGLHRFLWIYLLPILLCLTEILQLFSFIPGTFDILDVCCYIVPMIISLLIDIRYEKV